MSIRADTLAIKAQLGDLLGSQGEFYWEAFGRYLTGKATREEFDLACLPILQGDAGACANFGHCDDGSSSFHLQKQLNYMTTLFLQSCTTSQRLPCLRLLLGILAGSRSARLVLLLRSRPRDPKLRGEGWEMLSCHWASERGRGSRRSAIMSPMSTVKALFRKAARQCDANPTHLLAHPKPYKANLQLFSRISHAVEVHPCAPNRCNYQIWTPCKLA